jgi:hypothetical protein
MKILLAIDDSPCSAAAVRATALYASPTNQVNVLHVVEWPMLLTPMAIASERPATLATYRMQLGDKFMPVNNVFVPLWIKGRRWGNYELAYRDD